MLVFLSIFWTFSMIWNHNVLISFCFDSERRKVCWFTQQLSTLMLTLSFPVINEKSNSRKYFASFVNSENSETRLKIYNTWMLIYLGIVTHWTEKKNFDWKHQLTIRIWDPESEIWKVNLVMKQKTRLKMSKWIQCWREFKIQMPKSDKMWQKWQEWTCMTKR